LLIDVAREQLARVLKIIDPIGTVMRQNNQLVRTTYCVPGPNYLWHIYGHDKLARYFIN
jgi:hypothetical protein